MSFRLETYFNNIPVAINRYKAKGKDVLWILENLPQIIADFQNQATDATTQLPDNAKLMAGGSLYFEGESKLNENYIGNKIFIGAGTSIEPGALIRPDVVILGGGQLRHCSYIREYSFIGEKSVIGHCTEVKQSLLMDHVECGHFNYIGNSVIGSYVNLGAGAKLANLEFRSLSAKTENRFPAINLARGLKIKSGKLGAIIGEGSEIGCNAVLSPGTFLAQETKVLPNICVSKGDYHQTKKQILGRNKKD